MLWENHSDCNPRLIIRGTENAPAANINVAIDPTAIPGLLCGITMRQWIRNVLAPKSFAASIWFRSNEGWAKNPSLKGKRKSTMSTLVVVRWMCQVIWPVSKVLGSMLKRHLTWIKIRWTGLGRKKHIQYRLQLKMLRWNVPRARGYMRIRQLQTSIRLLLKRVKHFINWWWSTDHFNRRQSARTKQCKICKTKLKNFKNATRTLAHR